MKRFWLSTLNFPMFILLVAFALGIQSSLFNFQWIQPFRPDVILIAAIWCGLRRTFTEGGILVLIFSSLLEIHSGAPRGFYMSIYMILYLGLRAYSRFYSISRFSSLIAVTLGCSILSKVILLVLSYFLGISGNLWRHILIQILPSAGMAGLIGFWAYRWLDFFDRITLKVERSKQLIADELLVEEGI